MKTFCCTRLFPNSGQWSLGLLVALFAMSGIHAADGPAVSNVAPNTKVQAAIVANEQAFLNAVLASEVAALNEMLSDDFVYVHENGLISIKAQFMTDFLAKGYEKAVLGPKQPEEPMRQYGNTLFTIGLGHLRLKGEPAYPATTVTHVWVDQGGKWVLVHRHECHSGKPIGQQLGPTGGPNTTDKLGSKPSSVLSATCTHQTFAQDNSLVAVWETEPVLFSCESVWYSSQDQLAEPARHCISRRSLGTSCKLFQRS